MTPHTSIRDLFELYVKLYTALDGVQKGEGLKQLTQHITNQQTLDHKLPFDESTLISKLSSHLTATKSKQDAVTFRRLYEQLSSCMDLQSRNAMLSFLLFMSESNSSAAGASSMTTLRRDFSLKMSNSSSTTTNAAENVFPSPTIDRMYPTIGIKPILRTTSSDNGMKVTQRRYQSRTSNTTTDSGDRTGEETARHGSEAAQLADDLVQDVIYSFTGIQGKYLKKDIIAGGFKLDPKARQLNIMNAGMILRLGELGYYHDQVQSFTNPKSGRSPLGLLGQGLVTALKAELTQYYGMVASLQEQLNRHRRSWDASGADQVSLLKLMLWAAEPLHRLQWLVEVADACQEKKGGALASAVATFQMTADPNVQTLIHELMVAVCGPLQHMLSKWLLEGEIDDPHSEFFIEILPEVGPDRLWSDKYRVREAMLPSFISRELANKILVTGKSINFLREVCEDKTPVRGKEELKQCFKTNHDNLFATVPDTRLHVLIDTAYFNTSKKVLDIVMGPHKLLQHLHAMRSYLLLGQGDFIGILIENLKPELDRPAKDLHSYELSSILDSAIRSSSAQYDDPEILSQLDVRMLESFEGDVGWEVFVLRYTVRGPLSTMLEPSMSKYITLFKPLWRMKHLELVLSSKIWKEQISNAKLLRSMQKELNTITYRLHLYSSEMIHFIHQMQYYISFEVIECQWTNMLDKVRQAKALDDILDAHEEFLREVKIGSFVGDNDSLLFQMNNVFNTITKLEQWQDTFYAYCFKELHARKRAAAEVIESEAKGVFGATSESRFERDKQRQIFEDDKVKWVTSLEKIGTAYEKSVRAFLLLLASSTDHNLQLFGTRLDFNEYYKKRDQRLDAPLTFASMRHSSMMHSQNSHKSSGLSSGAGSVRSTTRFNN